MQRMRKHVDWSSLIVILVTFTLFFVSLFFTGLTHDILLEAGVFLVSVKLILMSHRLAVRERALHLKLDTIYKALTEAGICRLPTAKEMESWQGSLG